MIQCRSPTFLVDHSVEKVVQPIRHGNVTRTVQMILPAKARSDTK